MQNICSVCITGIHEDSTHTSNEAVRPRSICTHQGKGHLMVTGVTRVTGVAGPSDWYTFTSGMVPGAPPITGIHVSGKVV